MIDLPKGWLSAAMSEQGATWRRVPAWIKASFGLPPVPASMNINDNVKVKLTKLGFEIHRQEFDDTWRDMGYGIKPPVSYTRPTVDKDGYSTFQLWVFMATFGPYIHMAQDPLFEDNEIAVDGMSGVT